MREIPLTRGQVALVDDCDFEAVSAHKWYAQWSSNAAGYYARTNIRSQGRRKGVLLHRFILGATDPSMHVDHRNMNGLDNTRENLRTATRQQNSANRRVQSNNKSGLKGAHYNKQCDSWTASIQVDGEFRYLGMFQTAQDAHTAYSTAAQQAFGEFARTA
jgi:hypothetical protein